MGDLLRSEIPIIFIFKAINFLALLGKAIQYEKPPFPTITCNVTLRLLIKRNEKSTRPELDNLFKKYIHAKMR